MLRREHGLEKAKMREWLETIPAKLETAKENLANAQADNVGAKKVAAMEELPFDNKRLHAEITRAVANLKKGDDKPIAIGTVGGFAVSVKATEQVTGNLLNASSEIVVRIVVRGESEYSCEAGRNETDNNVVRLKNVFASIIPKREESNAAEVIRLSENLEQAKVQVNVPYENEERIVELKKLIAELDTRLSGITQQEDVIADDDDFEQSEIKSVKKSEAKSNTADSADNDDDKPPTPPTPDGAAAEIPRRGRAA